MVRGARIVDVGIGAGLVEHDVAVGHLREHVRQTLKNIGAWNGQEKNAPPEKCRTQSSAHGGPDDVVGAVAVVHVEVEDADALSAVGFLSAHAVTISPLNVQKPCASPNSA